MKLQIEEWIANQKISEESESLMTEAVLCYKSNAYRASLLFSYLCFQTIVKSRILVAIKPDNFQEGEWSQILNSLRNENTWDEKVFECLQRKEAKNIFLLNDDIRHQIAYWKNRRNDCVHSKNDMINHSHVESFWSFMRVNLPKIVVNGSLGELIIRIKNHYDINLTPPDADIALVVKDIPNIVSEAELTSFFSTIAIFFQENAGIGFGKYLDFWDKLFALHDEAVTNHLSDFIKTNDRLLMFFINESPQRVIHFDKYPSFIRNLWNTKIFNEWHYYNKNGLKLLVLD